MSATAQKRRHLNESQRAMAGARIATMPRGNPAGANQHGRGNTEISVFPHQDDAAAKLSISPDSIQFARRVLESGNPQLIALVEHLPVPKPKFRFCHQYAGCRDRRRAAYSPAAPDGGAS